jgi:transposase InsO family protein
MNNRLIPQIEEQYIKPSHPIAFSSPRTIRGFYKQNVNEILPVKSVDEALSGVDSYTLHREYKKPKERNPFFIYSLREQIQADLIDVRQLAKHNDGVTFILTAIDCFSKRAWIEPMENKTAKTSLRVIEKVVASMMPKPKAILFDRGSEFKNVQVRKYLEEEGIKLIHPNSEMKAAIIERFNRSIQDLIYRYMTENETFRYIDMLQDLSKTYNNRGHRTLKYLTPMDAEKTENKGKVLDALNEHYTRIVLLNKKVKYEVGQTVRVKALPSRFDRGYHERFNREHFKIINVTTRMPIAMYTLQSLNNNEIIKGNFYSNELQPIKGDIYKMTVLKSRRRRGKLQHFVKWRDFDDSHNEWLDAENVTASYVRE